MDDESKSGSSKPETGAQAEESTRILLVGDSKCGKNSLIVAFCGQRLTQLNQSKLIKRVRYTDAANYGDAAPSCISSIKTNEDIVMLRPLSYPNVKVVLLCYAIDDRKSMKNAAEKWYPEIRKHFQNVPVVLVGTKGDTRCSRNMQNMAVMPTSYKMGMELAEELGAQIYLECSTVTKEGVQEVFNYASVATSRSESPDDPTTNMLNSKKIVLFGNDDCGKKSLIYSCLNETLPKDKWGFINRESTTDVDGKLVPVDIWNIFGDPLFSHMRSHYCAHAEVVLLCFAIDDPQSLRNTSNMWYPEIREHLPNVPVFLVGNKIDLRADKATIDKLACKSETPVSVDEAEAVATKISARKYMECSAKTGEGVKDVFKTALLSVMSAEGEP